MKKVYALIILSIFLISLVPTITAQRIKTAKLQTANRAETRAQAQTEERAETSKISAPKIEAFKATKLQDLTKRSAFKKYSKEFEFKARKVSKAQLEKARKSFVKAKENFLKAKEKYQTAQQKFSEAKLRVRECEDNETDGCSQIREQIKTHARENIMAIADRIIEHLNKLKAKIEANEDLSEEAAAEMIANIDEQIEAIEEIKNIIETSESKEDIIDAAKDLKKDWKGMKNRVKLNTARTVNAKIGGIIVKSRQLEVKLDRIIERMQNNGIDTSSIELLIGEFNTKVEEAKTYYETAVESFKEAKSTTPNTDLIREGQAAMKAAHKTLQEAQKILRNIVLSIKQAGGEDDIEECETTADCEEDEVCTEGECVEAEDECTVDEQCCLGDVCDSGLINCSIDYHQVFEGCNENCTAIVSCAEDECTEVDEQCCIGDVCDGGNETCAEGSIPQFDSCNENCTAIITCVEEDECTEDADCGTGQVCTEGECVEAEEEECTEVEENCCLGDICSGIELTCEGGFVPEFQSCEENCTVIASCVEETTGGN